MIELMDKKIIAILRKSFLLNGPMEIDRKRRADCGLDAISMSVLCVSSLWFHGLAFENQCATFWSYLHVLSSL